MTEIEYLKCKLEDTEKAFDKLYKRYIELLKQQGKLEIENEQLRQSIEHMISKATEISNRNVQLHKQLKEKEQDEQLYANEIVKLNKEVKDNQFLRLGNDY